MSNLARKSFLRYLLTSSFVALVMTPTALIAQTLADTSWTEYFGASGGPYLNWGNTSRLSNAQVGSLKSSIERGDDIVIGDAIGLASATQADIVANFLNSIEADGGQAFRNEVYGLAVDLRRHQINLGLTDQVLLWEFGNEVTSLKYTLSIRSWAGEPAQPAQAADPFIIPIYVEYYLAPGVQAIEAAETATGSNIPVFLGSIGNASAQSKREFLYDLLNYEIVGIFAESLAGLTVADIVDYVDIHYTVAKNTHVNNEKGRPIKHLKGSYELALDEIYDPWVRSGLLAGLWSTEEGGRQIASSGYGAANAMLVTARYLHWWGDRGVSPEQGRTLFFGTKIGPPDVSSDLAMQTLYEFLGPTPLVEVPGAIVAPAGDWETYLFESVHDADKRVGFVIPSWSDAANNEFTEFEIDATNWPGNVSASVTVYGLGATTTTTATVVRQNDVLTITVPNPIVTVKRTPPSIVIQLQRN